VTSSKLYNEVKAYGDLKHFETPYAHLRPPPCPPPRPRLTGWFGRYVVRMHNVHQLAAAQECFVFDTPNYPPPGEVFPVRDLANLRSGPRPGAQSQVAAAAGQRALPLDDLHDGSGRHGLSLSPTAANLILCSGCDDNSFRSVSGVGCAVSAGET
jgi:hypothetical protein